MTNEFTRAVIVVFVCVPAPKTSNNLMQLVMNLIALFNQLATLMSDSHSHTSDETLQKE